SYKGKTVFIRRTDAHLPAGEYFDAELLGLIVFDCESGEELGTVTDVLTYPAHKVYEVRGSREYLIPAVPGVFIKSIDADAGVMKIHNMKGLATDEN
ncbi:MAG: 16S rRNA processing protein RimM, partial [Clostridiales bacterium]|nr:16S rRNA processing protein RimM [Clostridiales bacterium]